MAAAARPDRLETILDLVRANGGRITSPRRAILQALIDHEGEHPTAELLTQTIQRQQPDVHESTVYRFLDDLERLGVVEHAHLGHGPAVYHFADEDHHHLVCEECGIVVQVDASVFAAMRRRVADEFGFVVDERHFAILGRCRECARD